MAKVDKLSGLLPDSQRI